MESGLTPRQGGPFYAHDTTPCDNDSRTDTSSEAGAGPADPLEALASLAVRSTYAPESPYSRNGCSSVSPQPCGCDRRDPRRACADCSANRRASGPYQSAENVCIAHARSCVSKVLAVRQALPSQLCSVGVVRIGTDARTAATRV